MKDTFFMGDFSTAGYETGVTTKWNKLIISPATDTVGIDYASQWTDYSVEMKGKILSTSADTAHAKIGLMGRLSVNEGVTTFYYAYFRKGASNIWLKRYPCRQMGKRPSNSLIIRKYPLHQLVRSMS